MKWALAHLASFLVNASICTFLATKPEPSLSGALVTGFGAILSAAMFAANVVVEALKPKQPEGEIEK